jgi:hypothetical protein
LCCACSISTVMFNIKGKREKKLRQDYRGTGSP